MTPTFLIKGLYESGMEGSGAIPCVVVITILKWLISLFLSSMFTYIHMFIPYIRTEHLLVGEPPYDPSCPSVGRLVGRWVCFHASIGALKASKVCEIKIFLWYVVSYFLDRILPTICPIFRMHTFRVRCATRAGEQLAVTGSTAQLGGWSKHGILFLDHKPNRSVGMQLFDKYSDRRIGSVMSLPF